MIVLITGSRYYKNRKKVEDVLLSFHGQYKDELIVVHGDAKGCDGIVSDYCTSIGITQVKCPANWKLYGNKAGTIRNKFMIDMFKPELVIAFPGKDSKGTWDCVNKAKELYIHVDVIIYKKGDTNEE